MSSPPHQGRKHLNRNIVVVAFALVVVVVGATLYLLPSDSSNSCANPSQGPTFKACPILTIVPNSLTCTSYASCQITVQNTGAAGAWIYGAGPTSGDVTFSTCPAGIEAPGNTTFKLTISGGSAGKAVQGYLIFENDGSVGGDLYLDFSTVLPLTGGGSAASTTCIVGTGTVTNSTSTH